MRNAEQVNLSDALYEFTLAKEVPNADLLEDFIQRYPLYSKELTELAIELIVDSFAEASVEDSFESSNSAGTKVAVSRAISHYQNRLHEIKNGKEMKANAALPRDKIPSNPFKNMDRAAFQSFSHSVNVNRMLATKIRDRQIDAGTIPASFFSRMADSLDIPSADIVAYMHLPTAVATGVQSFKADCKPYAQAKQTYEDAVRTSMLTEDQKKDLLSLIKKD